MVARPYGRQEALKMDTDGRCQGMLELLQCGRQCGTQKAEMEIMRCRELEMGLALSLEEKK